MRLDRHKFRSWLERKAPAEVVGTNRDCHSCPLALFYYEASDGCEVVIWQDGWGRYMIDRGYNNRELPYWATQFVFDIDGDQGGEITASRALATLASSDQAEAK